MSSWQRCPRPLGSRPGVAPNEVVRCRGGLSHETKGGDLRGERAEKAKRCGIGSLCSEKECRTHAVCANTVLAATFLDGWQQQPGVVLSVLGDV